MVRACRAKLQLLPLPHPTKGISLHHHHVPPPLLGLQLLLNNTLRGLGSGSVGVEKAAVPLKRVCNLP
jgi:hypothetical protein